jgi:Protein of unknown function (DUF3102)
MSDIPVHAERLPVIAVNDAGNAEVADSFDYGSLSPEDAQAVRECGARIRTEMKNAAAAAIAIGRALIEVKKILRHGAFGTWVKSKCGFSLRSGQNYMRVARLADKNATVALLPLATSYRMTGRRTSRWLLTTAAERAADGQEPTEAEFEHLYSMMLRASKARRARRMSQGLAQNAGIRTSDRNSRAQSVAQSYRANVADKNTRTQILLSPSLAETAEENAEWILNECGEGPSISLVLMWGRDELDETIRVLRRKLYAIKAQRERDELSK